MPSGHRLTLAATFPRGDYWPDTGGIFYIKHSEGGGEKEKKLCILSNNHPDAFHVEQLCVIPEEYGQPLFEPRPAVRRSAIARCYFFGSTCSRLRLQSVVT